MPDRKKLLMWKVCLSSQFKGTHFTRGGRAWQQEHETAVNIRSVTRKQTGMLGFSSPSLLHGAFTCRMDLVPSPIFLNFSFSFSNATTFESPMLLKEASMGHHFSRRQAECSVLSGMDRLCSFMSPWFSQAAGKHGVF